MSELPSQSKEVNPAHDKRIAVSICVEIVYFCFYALNIPAIINLNCLFKTFFV